MHNLRQRWFERFIQASLTRPGWKGDSPSSRLDDHITEQLGTPLNPAILLVEDLEQARTVRQIISDVQTRHGADSVFLRSASLVDLLPTDVERRQAELARLRNLVSQLPASFLGDPRVKQLQELLGARPYGLDASHQGLRSIGQIALLGVVCTFLGTTAFFPALLALIERWKLRHGEEAGEGAVIRSLQIVTAGEPASQSEEQKSA